MTAIRSWLATPALADTLADAMALERRQLLRPDER